MESLEKVKSSPEKVPTSYEKLQQIIKNVEDKKLEQRIENAEEEKTERKTVKLK